jgi:hypothetical protein
MTVFQDPSAGRLKSLLPSEALGWKAEAADHVYDRESIFEYIDGAGEVYRAFNFRQLLSRRFHREGKPDIIIDLFDMGSSADAFGVFTHDLEGEDAGLGQGSNYKGGLLTFWRERYLVCLFAEGETAETREALFALAKPVAAAIGRDGAKPALIGLVPPDFAPAGAIRYLHSPVILNYHFFVSAENILGLGPDTEAVLAKSGDKGQNGVLLVVKYPGAAEAVAAFARFTKAYLHDAAGGSGIVRTEDGKWTAARLIKDIVAVVFGAPADAAAKALLNKVAEAIK